MAQQRSANAQQDKPPVRGQVLDEKGVDKALRVGQGKFLSIVKKNPEPLRPAWAREVSYATQLVMKNEQLRKSEPQSLANAVVNLANIGLTLNPVKQHCTIVPRWNKDIGLYEASLMVMYRGLLYLAAQAGVVDVVSEVVYALDEFAPIERTEQGDRYSHKINVMAERGTDDNAFRGVYVAARMPSGHMKVEWVPAADVYKMRAQSDSYWIWGWETRTRDNGSTYQVRVKTDEVDQESAWVVWFDEMAKKSGIKRAQKRWEEAMQDESRWQHFRKAVDIDNRTMRMDRDEREKAEDAEVIPALSLEQVTEIESRVKDLKLRDSARFITQICDVYRKKALSEIPSTKYEEILERIANAKEEAENRRKAKEGK